MKSEVTNLTAMNEASASVQTQVTLLLDRASRIARRSDGDLNKLNLAATILNSALLMDDETDARKLVTRARKLIINSARGNTANEGLLSRVPYPNGL